ncbi:MAG TPA: PorP/SprF family type IX secretion system membrane protein [Saprospiraceae bacterium]|nr:PorP/SprF family type IX secretion system membrane protein [Saprospiraceae bacterium]
MKHKYTKLIAGLFLLVGSLNAQDIHFSQFYQSPLTLNPALTGVMNCNTRVIANYRNQWAPVIPGNAYNTFSLSYDQKLPVGRYDNFGFGINLWTDVAGELDFKTQTLKLTGAYSRRVAGTRKKSHYIVAGAELGLSQRSFDYLKGRWGSQVNGDFEYDPTIPSGENLDNIDQKFLFGDIGLGVLWFSVLGKAKNFYIGGAYSHLNQPNLSFYLDDVVPYYTKAAVHAGGELPLGDQVSVLPGAVAFFQGPSMEINFGASTRFFMGSGYDDQSFQFGAWFRVANHYEKALTADALILSTRFDYRQFGIGFSYDINVSSLRQAANSNGSFEFSMIYLLCGPQSRGVYCPRF